MEYRNENDRRVRRTEQRLTDTLIDLMKEKPLSEIAVTELTQRANVNRATFYRHYQDVYALKEKMELDLTLEFQQAIQMSHPLESYKELRLLCIRILYFIVANHDQCMLLFRQNNTQVLFHKFQKILFDTFYIPRAYLDKRVQFGIDFIFAGLVSVLQKWLEENQPVPVEVLVDYIIDNIKDGFHLIPDHKSEAKEEDGEEEDGEAT